MKGKEKKLFLLYFLLANFQENCIAGITVVAITRQQRIVQSTFEFD